MTDMQLVDAVGLLAQSQEDLAAAKAKVERLQKEIDATPLGQALLKAKDVVQFEKTLEADCKASVRALGLEEYEATQQRELCFGLKVRIMRDLIYDEQAVMEWAKENAPVLLMLNHRMFQASFGKHLPDLVTMEQRPTVTIPRDLQKRWREGQI